jgi:hypothetical protein
MRRLLGTLLALGLLLGTAPMAVARTITFTEAYNTNGTQCYDYSIPGVQDYWDCMKAHGVIHFTQRDDGGYTYVGYSDIVYWAEFSMPGCEFQHQAEATFHEQYTGNVWESAWQENQFMTVGEWTIHSICSGWEHTAHCAYNYFYHFTDDRVVFDDPFLECT